VTTQPERWLIVLAAGLGTLLFRLSFILTFGWFDEVPPRLRFVLRFVPAAVLSALVAPAILAPDGALVASPLEPRVIAGAVAAVVAWRSGNVLATIVAGMVALWTATALV
jgi:branched-subunit amino acid transport protein